MGKNVNDVNKAINDNRYINPFSYNIIYIFRAIDQGSKYENLLKIGKASITINKEKGLISKEELNQAAIKRINEYTKTAGFEYQLLWTELAINKNNEAFSDVDVHHVLENSNIHHVIFDNNNAREWFRVNLEVAKIAIKCVIEGKKSLPNYVYAANNEPEIILRKEQQEAISKALRAFKTQPRKCLWNCKMRFGKTICALHLIADSLDFPNLNFKKVLIITNRPSVVKEWFDDYKLFFAKKMGDSHNCRFFGKVLF